MATIKTNPIDEWMTFAGTLRADLVARERAEAEAREEAEAARNRLVIASRDFMTGLCAEVEIAAAAINDGFGGSTVLSLGNTPGGVTTVTLRVQGQPENWYLEARAILYADETAPGCTVDVRSPHLSGARWFPFALEGPSARLLIDGEACTPTVAAARVVRKWFADVALTIVNRRSRL